MQYPIWLDSFGNKVTCVEKIKVMQENLDELQQFASDVLSDAILMGVTKEQITAVLIAMMNSLPVNL